MNGIDSALDSIGVDGAGVIEALAQAALVMALAWFLARVIRRRIQRYLSLKSFGRNGAVLIGRLISLAIYILAFTMVMGILGVSSTGLLTFLGAFTVALGLSLQDVFKNFFAGVFLLFERPFRVGDVIKVQDVEGEILGIDIRTTQVRVADGSVVLIPNSSLFTLNVTNRSRTGWRRLDLTVTATGIGASDLEEIIHRQLGTIEAVAQPVPAPIVTLATPDTATMTISILVRQNAGTQQQVIESLLGAHGSGTIEVSRA